MVHPFKLQKVTFYSQTQPITCSQHLDFSETLIVTEVIRISEEERQLLFVLVKDFRGTTGAQTLGREGRKPHSISPVNHSNPAISLY